MKPPVKWRCEGCGYGFERADEGGRLAPECPKCPEQINNQCFHVCSLCESGLVGNDGIDPRDLDSCCTNEDCWGHIRMYDRLHLYTTAAVILSNTQRSSR